MGEKSHQQSQTPETQRTLLRVNKTNVAFYILYKGLIIKLCSVGSRSEEKTRFLRQLIVRMILFSHNKVIRSSVQKSRDPQLSNTGWGWGGDTWDGRHDFYRCRYGTYTRPHAGRPTGWSPQRDDRFGIRSTAGRRGTKRPIYRPPLSSEYTCESISRRPFAFEQLYAVCTWRTKLNTLTRS